MIDCRISIANDTRRNIRKRMFNLVNNRDSRASIQWLKLIKKTLPPASLSNWEKAMSLAISKRLEGR